MLHQMMAAAPRDVQCSIEATVGQSSEVASMMTEDVGKHCGRRQCQYLCCHSSEVFCRQHQKTLAAALRVMSALKLEDVSVVASEKSSSAGR